MIRLDQVNTFWYEGIIVEFKDAEARVKGNRLYTARYITIRNVIGFKRMSKVIMCLPKAFDSKRVVIMKKCAVQARFHFCIRVVKGDNGGEYNIVQCLSIEPKEDRYKHLRQEVIYDPYKIRGNVAPIVDNDGYSFPYDY